MNNKRRERRLQKARIPDRVRILKRGAGLCVVLVLCVFGLIFRMWYIQSTFGEEYEQAAAEQRALVDMERVHEIFTPVRGSLVDRHMQPITGTQQVFTVFLDVEALHNRHLSRGTAEDDIREEVINGIALALEMPRWELSDLFRLDEHGNLAMRESRNRWVLRHNVPAEVAIPLSEMFPEVHREETSLRWYQDPFFAPQVVGFLRGDSAWGLEAFYQTELEGEQGRNIWVQGETETVPVRDGYTVVTTIDSDIQRLAQHYVDRTYIQHPSQFVGMIVMDPFTGEVLAMSQSPTFSLEEPFNPDYFTAPHIVEEWESMDNSERTTEVMSLWRNYHTTRSSEPGSVFKPFVIAAAIEERIITSQSSFFCEGVRVIHEMEVRCHNHTVGCGSLSLRRALYRSCNLAMSTINRDMGRDLFYQYRGYFGFGERTGIDLPAEESVSNPSVMYPYNMLNPVEMATSAMGQGFNATTMQIINGYAALINGGNLMRPYLVSHIVDAQGNVVREIEPEVVRRVISAETSHYIREEMRYVVSQRPGVGEENSTGWRSYIPGHSIGGKTGTAQQGRREDNNHNLTYVCFLPVENPQYLVLMTIDHIEDENRFAGDTVVPIVREFLLDLIRLRNIPPVDETQVVETELFGTPMPDFSGQNLSEAVRGVLNSSAIGYHVVGGGTIISHTWPAPGHPMPETSPIIFYMDAETRISERMALVPNVVGLTEEMANLLLVEAGLPVVSILDAQTSRNDADFNPRTTNPEPVGEDFVPPTPPTRIVHQQFPSAGSEIEMGTQVIIRCR